ncbi:uncharacterized protein reeld1 [Halichoeres trimaculatus]|uniref:uncharacterized protein reeld1 n=1 Tax=Halichoeres trimaculatus TaxID=147232 RepID=UPI003D9EB54F
MQFAPCWFGVGVILFSLAPPTLAFSRGASKSSCQEMTPGHIRAQPQDPEQSHVTLRTSASSYLPGQLVTVTVRSSRDFMGFLLQARSVEGTRTGAKTGVRSTSLGPVLVGGSWVLTPPGTHILRCFTAGDTLTHSDKQLKRNLSFVWKAPDVPMGDVKFYVTVVQSYFVHWAGIESPVVRDGSRSYWSGSNNTGMDGGSSGFLQVDEVTDPPVAQGIRTLNQKGETTSASTTLRPLTTTSSGRPIEKSQETSTEVTHPVLERQVTPRVLNKTLHLMDQVENENITERNDPLTSASSRGVDGTQRFTTGAQLTEVTHPVLDRESSATLTHLEVEHLTNQEGNEKKVNQTLEFLQSLSKSTDTSGFFSGVTEESRSPDVTKGPSTTTIKSTIPALVMNFSTTLGTLGVPRVDEGSALLGSGSPPNLESETSTSGSPSSVTEETGTETGSPVTQTLASSDSLPPTSLSSEDGKAMEGFTTLLPNITGNNSNSLFLNASLSPLAQDGDTERNTSDTSNPILPPVSETSTTRPHLGSQSGTSSTLSTTQASSKMTFPKTQTSLSKLVVPSESPTLQSNSTASLKLLPDQHLSTEEYQNTTSLPQTQLEGGPTERLPHGITHKPKPLTSFLQALSQTIPTTTKSEDDSFQQDQTQTDPPMKVSSTSGTSWFKPHSLTGAPKVYSNGLTTIQSLTTLRTINPPTSMSTFNPTFTMGTEKQFKHLQSGAKINTVNPIFASMPTSSPSSVPVSTHAVTSSSLVHTSSTTPPYPKTPSTQTFSTQTSSPSPNPSTMTNRFKTVPALSALPSASPMPTPPNLPSVQPSPPSYGLNTLTSSTIPSSNSSHFTSTSAPLTTSAISSLTSDVSSSSSSSSFTDALSSPPTSPPSFSAVSSSSPGPSSSSYNSFQSTSPHPEPSPAPRRSPYNTTATTSSRQQLTPGQKLLIQNHITSSDPEPSPRTVVHQNPEPHPNLDTNIRPKLKPKVPNSNPEPNHPSSPSLTPGKEGKYPDIIPRHSSWELGMLLGCSASLGMVLVVGVRYMYRQACGKRTEVTLNDREREYGRGERGLIHVQECGDLVRVRRIRDNSFVLLAEYDILSSPGD